MIKAITTVSDAELSEGIKLYQKHKSKRFPIFLPVIFIFILSCQLWFMGRIEPISFFRLVIFIIIGLVIYWFVFFVNPRNQRKQLLNSIRTSPNYNKQIEWIFDEAGIVSSGKGFESKSSWKTIYEVLVVTKSGLLIFPQDNLCYWIPKSAFETDEDYESAIQLIQESVSKHKVV